MTGGVDTKVAADPRCPACGQPLGDQPVESCPLCAFVIGDSRATGEDVTPYAIAFENDQSRWFSMCKWVWTAGPERLKHLAMMRASQASRRFAAIHLVLFAFALGMLRATLLGWRYVSHAQASMGTVVKPVGQGWFRVSSLTPIPGNEDASALTGVWWNPAQALLGGAIALVAAFILIAVVRILVRVGVEVAHTRSFRGEHRMTAAQHYATGWLVPMILAAVVLWLHPTIHFGNVSTTLSSELVVFLPAGILAGVSLIFGWFWMLRLAASAPVDTRTRVTIMLAFVAPALVLGGASVWWFGLERLYSPLFDSLQMSF